RVFGRFVAGGSAHLSEAPKASNHLLSVLATLGQAPQPRLFVQRRIGGAKLQGKMRPFSTATIVLLRSACISSASSTSSCSNCTLVSLWRCYENIRCFMALGGARPTLPASEQARASGSRRRG